eukprot:scaffold251162_cov32-Tisochrysis_lutea.AAC.3
MVESAAAGCGLGESLPRSLGAGACAPASPPVALPGSACICGAPARTHAMLPRAMSAFEARRRVSGRPTIIRRKGRWEKGDLRGEGTNT